MSQMNLAKVDGIAHITLHGVELEIGYTIEPADPEMGLPEDYWVQYALAGDVDVFGLVDAIPGAWEKIEIAIAKLEADR